MIIINSIALIVLVCNVKYDFVFGYHREEIRCVEKEREALLRFQEGLIDDYGLLSSWGNETRKRECCKWRGVRCSNTTGHVMALLLPGDYEYDVYLGGEISSALLDLHHLQDLDLSENDFGGNRFPDFLCSMTQLQHLKLSLSNFSGIVPPQLGNLTNLQTLALAYNNMWSENLNWLYSDLSLLSGLSLSGSKISDANWAQHLLNLHSLQVLYLRNCGLVDVEPSSVGPSLNSSSSTPSLSILNLSENDLTSFSVDWNLRILYLWGNKLKTPPSSLWQLSKLEELDVSSNSLKGTITESNLNKLHNLKKLDLSFNPLTLDINPDWTPPFQLDAIGLASCNMGPQFPLWVRTQSNFSRLDLSLTGISGEVPKWFWSLSPVLKYLNLSHNHLSGTVPGFSSKFVKMIDVSYNKFTGPIPLFPPDIQISQLSQNMFSGSISSLCTMPYIMLWLLDLSNNQLAGELPNCWENMTNMFILNLSNNSFSGEIPHALGSLSGLSTLYLGNNNLYSFSEAMHVQEYIYYAVVSWKGQELQYRRTLTLLKLVDLSSNKLVGDIPGSFSSLRGLISLNLSSNSLTGTINPDIGMMKMLECLDLSSNRLTGAIPTGMAQLHFLAVLDLAKNNLSGKIPSSTQLQSIDASAYTGNGELCGSPLQLCPVDRPNPPNNNNIKGGDIDENGNDGILSLSFLQVLGILIILGFIIGFWGVVGSILVKESWRMTFFNFWDAVGDWLYVTTTIFWTKFRRN
ncbi:leucine-rich repeat receptor-like serine/threonine-protein kinase at1g17230 [Phtheirospermum japonicum]|uniref:Leucine-rich repeat receptor-like serine/threonine-protein kinase at1g17230 n=1 Tax=Phtheirospermum japonicum TaxID=374723 RepID=A0A830B4I8_9LAMI|nr:leucine-rich repeat receptor-like serine/threonine-protein kinase at1g17230 [Phtheirospermum japonicum]